MKIHCNAKMANLLVSRISSHQEKHDQSHSDPAAFSRGGHSLVTSCFSSLFCSHCVYSGNRSEEERLNPQNYDKVRLLSSNSNNKEKTPVRKLMKIDYSVCHT